MTEDQAITIARDLVARFKLDPCKLESIRRLPHAQGPTSASGDWVVRFAFEQHDSVACSSEVAMVVVDDATEEARLIGSL
jgi:hypothetical protein